MLLLYLRAPGPQRGAGVRSSLATFSSHKCYSLSVIWVGQAWLFAAGLMRAVSRDLSNKQRHAVTLSRFAGSVECIGSLSGVVQLHMAGKGAAGEHSMLLAGQSSS